MNTDEMKLVHHPYIDMPKTIFSSEVFHYCTSQRLPLAQTSQTDRCQLWIVVRFIPISISNSPDGYHSQF